MQRVIAGSESFFLAATSRFASGGVKLWPPRWALVRQGHRFSSENLINQCGSPSKKRRGCTITPWMTVLLWGGEVMEGDQKLERFNIKKMYSKEKRSRDRCWKSHFFVVVEKVLRRVWKLPETRLVKAAVIDFFGGQTWRHYDELKQNLDVLN